MNNETQLAKWREEGSHKWLAADTSKLSNHESYIEGYLRAKQETEQALPTLLITGEPSLWVAETHSDQVEFFFDDPTEGLDEGVSVTAYYTHAQPLQPITAIMLDDDEWTNLWIECSDESASDTEIDLSLFAEKVQKAFCEKNGIEHRGDTK